MEEESLPNIPDSPLARVVGKRLIEEVEKCSLLTPDGGQPMPKERHKQTKLADSLYVAHALIEDQTGHRVVVVGNYTPAIDPKLSPEVARLDILKRVDFLHPGTKPLDTAVYRLERLKCL